MKRILGFIQGVYYSITGIWPLVDIGSFMDVTGPKTDLWLVRTVGVLVLVIGIALIVGAAKKTIPSPVLILAMGSCIGFAAIDIIYVLNDTILPIYLADAFAQILLLLLWIVSLVTGGRRRRKWY